MKFVGQQLFFETTISVSDCVWVQVNVKECRIKLRICK